MFPLSKQLFGAGEAGKGPVVANMLQRQREPIFPALFGLLDSPLKKVAQAQLAPEQGSEKAQASGYGECIGRMTAFFELITAYPIQPIAISHCPFGAAVGQPCHCSQFGQCFGLDIGARHMSDEAIVLEIDRADHGRKQGHNSLFSRRAEAQASDKAGDFI